MLSKQAKPAEKDQSDVHVFSSVPWKLGGHRNHCNYRNAGQVRAARGYQPSFSTYTHCHSYMSCMPLSKHSSLSSTLTLPFSAACSLLLLAVVYDYLSLSAYIPLTLHALPALFQLQAPLSYLQSSKQMLQRREAPCVSAMTMQASGVGNTVDYGCGVYCHVCGAHAGCHGTCAVWRL